MDYIFVVYYMPAYYSVIDHCFHKNRQNINITLRNILELILIAVGL